MTLDCTTVTAQTCSFTLVIVPKPVLSDSRIAKQMIQFLEQRRFHMPTVLMARDEYGLPSSYYGRADLALHLVHIPLDSISWQQIALGS